MNDRIHHIFTEARAKASKAFWQTFMAKGYERDQLHEAPQTVKDAAFTASDRAGWKHLEEAGLVEEFGWNFGTHGPIKEDAPF